MYRLFIKPTDTEKCPLHHYLIYHDYPTRRDAIMAGEMLKNPAKGLFATPVQDYYVERIRS